METSTQPTNFMEQATVFLHALVSWEQNLPSLAWNDLRADAQKGRVALFCVDMINGFCHEGALSSPRVKSIIPAVVSAFESAYAIGVRDFLLAQDCHTPASVEFADFPPHCMAGTSEAETIPELASLPFAHLFTVVRKNSLNAFHGTHLGEWLDAHRDLSAVVIVGDCTDLCVYQAAVPLKLRANQDNRPLRVIVPRSCVDTYDLPLDAARQIGAPAHDGDLMHELFLYHMALNGVEVVSRIDD